ncbi:MAG: hypothetical protein HC889_11100 [Synechococcaceae cyanobacterium SM1_2_3]|nr:hypothetical protein [Synechococcaceae cyanobacterium SM1_2_3]
MKDDLIKHLDTALPDLGPAHPPPTVESIDKISKHFGIVLPDDLVELATRSKKFSSLFLSLGPDYPSRNHIIRVNSHWRHRRRTRRLPNHLVIITDGFMDDRFWCMDIEQPNAIQFWCPEPITYASVEPPPTRYVTFEAFIEGMVMGSDDQ